MITTETIRVILADDHRLFSDGLCALLTSFPHIQIVAQVHRSPEIFEKVHKYNPDVILLDFNMPTLNGMEVSRRLLTQNSQHKILVLSMYNEGRHIEEFKNLGVKGYLLKTVAATEVAKAIETIYRGNLFFDAPKHTGQPNNHSEDYFLKTFRLTGREVEVLRQIKAGRETKEISEMLFISALTVETHRKNICTKLNLRGRNELLRFTIDHDI
jgi:DNA-binding NarL/FixJ family response regulator